MTVRADMTNMYNQRDKSALNFIQQQAERAQESVTRSQPPPRERSRSPTGGANPKNLGPGAATVVLRLANQEGGTTNVTPKKHQIGPQEISIATPRVEPEGPKRPSPTSAPEEELEQKAMAPKRRRKPRHKPSEAPVKPKPSATKVQVLSLQGVHQVHRIHQIHLPLESQIEELRRQDSTWIKRRNDQKWYPNLLTHRTPRTHHHQRLGKLKLQQGRRSGKPVSRKKKPRYWRPKN